MKLRFAGFLRSAGLVQPGNRVVCAVSGGIDSMVMLHLFCAVRDKMDLRLVIAHANHQLRGDESDGDEDFVRAAARQLRIPFFSERVDTLGRMKSDKVSKQVSARLLRYEFFERVRQETAADYVATAHHADDNAETILMNVFRGTGVRGLAGIPIRRDQGKIIRPLLFARRREIEHYAAKHRISYRLDSSNASVRYRRNELRRNVIPLIEKTSRSRFVGSLNRLSRVMRAFDDLLTAEAHKSLKTAVSRDEQGRVSLRIAEMASRPRYLREAMVAEVLRELETEVDAAKVERLLELARLDVGSEVQCSGDLNVYKERESLVFSKTTKEPHLHQRVELGYHYSLRNFRFSAGEPFERPAFLGFSKGVEFVDAARLGTDLFLRSWEDGDWFYPLGMKAKKKVSDFFIDEKVPLYRKREVPIFESDGKVVWICGKRLDERFKVTDQTRRVVKLEFTHPSTSL